MNLIIGLSKNDIDQNNCPRIFGPATNFIFKKMAPMTVFL